MAAGVKFIPSKLSSISIRKVVECIDIHADNLDKLPREVKDRVLYLMSKRGAFTDSNIKKVTIYGQPMTLYKFLETVCYYT